MVSLLLGPSDRVTLVVPHIRIERADATIVPHEDTRRRSSIARAFELEPKPKHGQAEQRASRVVRVWLPNIELGSGFARGKVGDLPRSRPT